MTKKILIAEDEIPLLKILTEKISSLGYTVVQAKTGLEALQLFTDEKPDLVLLDIVMPEKSGLEVLEEIRIKLQSQIPVIIISNLDQNTDKEIALNLGVSEYIVKSNIKLTSLGIVINSVLA